MNGETSSSLGAEFLDDFFVEADEHLLNVRRALVHLEASVGKAQPDPEIVEELFRDFHSFKGISAIVGLAPAEAVAHATEDFLRLMRGRQAQLTGKGLEVLMSASQKLEQIVAAFRQRNALPGYESLLIDLTQQCASASVVRDSSSTAPQGTSGDADLLARVEEAKARGLLLWKYVFTPSQELSAQGTNVNRVREQLLKFGEILNSASEVHGPGAIAFEFLVAAREMPADIASWEAGGVKVQLVEHTEGDSAPALPIGPSTPEDETHNPFLSPSHVVRVDLKRLDDLMRIVGEMVIHRSRLDAQLTCLNNGPGRADLGGVQEASGGLGRSLRDLREAITRVRLVPVAEIFARMPFVVQGLCRQTQKKVRVKLEGQETAVDKYLIEKVKDPILHLVRNAFSHGVESPEERLAASKPAEATIELKASAAGDSVILHVRDDGRGLNPNGIIGQARKLGLEIPDVVDNTTLLKILCTPGFSTRDDADRAAGRGVGMAVVYSTVRELGGTLAMESEEGHGTQFTLTLPLTLAIAEMLIVRAAQQTCAVPQNVVREILHTTEAQIQMVNGIEAIPYRTGILPVVRLAGLFGLKGVTKATMCLLVISSDRGTIGLLTEDILGQREVVVRALRDPLIQVPGISGATELGDGKPVLILDGAALTDGNVRPAERASLFEEVEMEQ